MQTNVESIYACGDCIEQYHLVTGKPVYRPLGSTANKTSRIADDSITGGNLEFRGILGTGIFKIFDLAYAPPFSTTKDPVMYTGMILDNAISKGRPLITADDLDNLMNSGEKYNLIC
ncbi:MAG: hypothetical protein A2Y17_02280 [Clostridiales bacterium GWF2_38_85]|nr:MAG: hypothetical protein A2Y17_02280 [Clostridiales bacterium GWF2_38_85]